MSSPPLTQARLSTATNAGSRFVEAQHDVLSKDENGKRRLVIAVDGDGTAHITLFDQNGKRMQQIAPHD